MNIYIIVSHLSNCNKSEQIQAYESKKLASHHLNMIEDNYRKTGHFYEREDEYTLYVKTKKYKGYYTIEESPYFSLK